MNDQESGAASPDAEEMTLAEAIAQSLQDYWNSKRLYLTHCQAADIVRNALLRLQPRRAALRDLRELDDEGLAEESRAREVAFQDALAELARRSVAAGDPDWDERKVAALLAQKRGDIDRFDSNFRVNELPPPLFRMGYEWAALSIIRILEGVLKKPSEDIMMTRDFEHVGKGLYRPAGEPRPSDPRRRAALDLIKELERYGKSDLRGMFFRWKRKNAYAPGDDAALAARLKEKQEALSGGFLPRGVG
jgi:hypothetical protein